MARGLGVIGKTGGVKNVRIRVPADVQRIALTLAENDPLRDDLVAVGADGKPKAKSNLVRSTKRVGQDEADARAAEWQAQWKAVFADLRQRPDPTITTDALARIERWRRREVKAATGFDVQIALASIRPARSPREPGDGLDMSGTSSSTPGVTTGGAEWAEGFFLRRPHLPRAPGPDLKALRLVAALEAAEHGEAWRDVPDFDVHMTEVVGTISTSLRNRLRPAFARAWGEVEAAQERERQHAANLLKTVSEAQAGGVTLPAAPGYEPRRGDRTVGELLDAYALAKPGKDGVAPARLIREVIGAAKPVRAVTRDDARRVLALVPALPANVGQQARYRGLSLIQAIAHADAHDAATQDQKGKIKRISTTTAAHYMTRASMIWNWALNENDEWADRNPFRGLSTAFDDDDALDVRGFTNAELALFFHYVAPHKAADSYLFWVPALALNGARLSELCQLRVDDVRDDEGTPYLAIGLHDAAGNRDPMKSVKNAGSIRRAPIHPVTLDAGFLDFVERRRAVGGERLFADIKPYRQPKDDTWDWSHYPSRAFADVIDAAVSEDVGLRFHSFRHGFRTRAEDADIAEASIDAIAGWGQKTIGRKYGKREIERLAGRLGLLDYGELKI